MGLYDVIGSIAEKQIIKTDTGDNRIFGVVLGVVASNYDENMPGRVCVTVTSRDQDANELKWARVMMPSSGSKWGHYFLPEIGDQVLLAFEQGNIEKPYVIGCVPKDNNPFLKGSVDEKNQFKKITTKNGNTISFEDNQEGEGDKDKIKITTAKSGHRIELDNEKKTILVSDKEGTNKIEMNTEKGQMEIIVDKKLTIKVGQNIQLTLNGSDGVVELKADKFNVEANNALNLKANSKAKLSSSNVTLEASGMMKLESSGLLNASGSPIKWS